MEETRTGGSKEFFFSIIWAIILLCVGKIIISALNAYKIIGTIITIIMFCVLGFFVLTRYCAEYTFTLKDDRLYVNRKIGHRFKDADVAMSEVVSVTKQRPAGAPSSAQSMRTSVFSQKNIWYIVYEKNGLRNMLICEISKNMADKIKSRAKNSKR